MASQSAEASKTNDAIDDNDDDHDDDDGSRAEREEEANRKKNLQRIIFTHEVDLLEAIESQLQNLYLNTFQIIFYALSVLFHDSFAIRTDFVAQRACLPAHCPDARRVKAIDVDGGTHGVAWSRVKRGEENIQLYKIVFFSSSSLLCFILYRLYPDIS